MTEHPSPLPIEKRPPLVTVTCISLWLIALINFSFMLYIIAVLGIRPQSATQQGVVVFFAPLVILLQIVTGLGLWHMRKWGAILFFIPTTIILVFLYSYNVFSKIGNNILANVQVAILSVGSAMVFAYLYLKLWQIWKNHGFS